MVKMFKSGEVFTNNIEEVGTTDGLVAYWPLDDVEPGEPLPDEIQDIISANNGTIIGSPQFVQGISGSALDFDGVDDNVHIFHSSQIHPSTNYWSMSVWIYCREIPSTSEEDGILWKNEAYGFRVKENAVIQFYVYDTGYRSIESSANVFELNEWVFLTGVLDGSIIKLFINGDYIGETGNINSIAQTQNRLRFASQGGSSFRFFNGRLAEPRIYNRALTAEEIKTLYLVK